MNTYFEYRVKNGDTLSGIVFNMFGYTMRDQRYKGAVTHIMSLNPQLKTPNRIITGDILRLGVIPATKPIIASPSIDKSVPKSKLKLSPSKPQITNVVAPHNADNFWALSWLEENSNLLTIPSGVALGTVGNVMSNGNKALLAEVGDIFAEYKAGQLTKGQYDYRRLKTLNQLKKNIGPMEKLLSGRLNYQVKRNP